MPVSIDSQHPPPVPSSVTKLLGEAAAQRQNLLLEALDAAGIASAAKPTAPTAPTTTLAPATPPAGTAAPAHAGAAPAPVAATQVSISPQARQSLAQAVAALPGPSGLLGALVTASSAVAGSPGVLALPVVATGASSTAVLTPPAAWPTAGVTAPLQTLLSALVQQVTTPVLPQQVIAIQPWPAALLPLIDPDPSTSARAADMPPLETWLVQEGTVHTAEGPRSITVTLRVPAPWLRALEQDAAPAGAARSWDVWLVHSAPATAAGGAASAPLNAPFQGPGAALVSGAFALVLQSPEPGGPRTNALLLVEMQPLAPKPEAQMAVYGREMLQPRPQDPWTQMAVLQASGHAPRDEDIARHGSAALCDTPSCPYQAQAACVQPFCMAMRSVPVVGATATPEPSERSPD